jgi:hypothetical protein
MRHPSCFWLEWRHAHPHHQRAHPRQQQVETFLTQESHRAVRAPPVQSLKDEELFVLDTVRGCSVVAQ